MMLDLGPRTVVLELKLVRVLLCMRRIFPLHNSLATLSFFAQKWMGKLEKSSHNTILPSTLSPINCTQDFWWTHILIKALCELIKSMLPWGNNLIKSQDLPYLELIGCNPFRSVVFKVLLSWEAWTQAPEWGWQCHRAKKLKLKPRVGSVMLLSKKAWTRAPSGVGNIIELKSSNLGPEWGCQCHQGEKLEPEPWVGSIMSSSWKART